MLLAEAGLAQDGHAAQLAVQQEPRRLWRIDRARRVGDDDAPDTLASQVIERQRRTTGARFGGLRFGEHRLVESAAAGGGPALQARQPHLGAADHQDPPDEPALPHHAREDHAADDHADQPHEQNLGQPQQFMAGEANAVASCHHQDCGKGQQPRDHGVHQEASPLDADLRPIETDSGRDDDHGAGQHGRQIQIGGIQDSRTHQDLPGHAGRDRKHVGPRQHPVDHKERKCQLAEAQQGHLERHETSQDASHSCPP